MKRINFNAATAVVSVLGGLFTVLPACSEKNSPFQGTSPKMKLRQAHGKPAGEEAPQEPKPKPVPTAEAPRPEDTTFQGALPDVRTTFGKKDIWTVTSGGLVRRFSLSGVQQGQASEDYAPNGEWQLEGSTSGHRTFVSEIGLLVGKTSSGIYRVGHDTPTGTRIPRSWTDSEVSGSRICVNSFKVGGQAFVGAGFNTTAGDLKFVKIPIDASRADKLNLASARIINTQKKGSWGYSCFTDQAHSTFWGMQGGVHGFNFATEATVNTSQNGWETKTIANVVFDTVGRKAYAIAGDAQGRLLNSSGYTSAYEQVTDVVFQSLRNARIRVIQGRCFDVDANCAVNQGAWEFDLAPLGVEVLGPLSSMNDGHVVGLTRTKGDVLLLSLRDAKDPSKGVAVKKVGEAGGDPYMYTDFTGATLYAAEVEKTLSLAPQHGFVPGKSVTQLKLGWTADSGTAEPWRGLALEVRCYSKDGVKPGYSRLEQVPPAGEAFEVTVPGCRDAPFDAVDVHIVPLNTSGGFSHTAGFTISGVQEG